MKMRMMIIIYGRGGRFNFQKVIGSHLMHKGQHIFMNAALLVPESFKVLGRKDRKSKKLTLMISYAFMIWHVSRRFSDDFPSVFLILQVSGNGLVRFRALDPETAEARFGRWWIEGFVDHVSSYQRCKGFSPMFSTVRCVFLEEKGLNSLKSCCFFLRIHLEYQHFIWGVYPLCRKDCFGNFGPRWEALVKFKDEAEGKCGFPGFRSASFYSTLVSFNLFSVIVTIRNLIFVCLSVWYIIMITIIHFTVVY